MGSHSLDCTCRRGRGSFRGLARGRKRQSRLPQAPPKSLRQFLSSALLGTPWAPARVSPSRHSPTPEWREEGFGDPGRFLREGRRRGECPCHSPESSSDHRSWEPHQAWVG